MMIQYQFTSRHTIRIECGGEVIEVLLPTGASPVIPAPGPKPSDSEGARGIPIGVAPTVPGPRPKRGPVVMAIIADRTRPSLDFDWTQFDPDVQMYSLDDIGMAEDGLALFFPQGAPQLEINRNGLRIVNVGVTPWSGTTPGQLENLRRIVDNQGVGIDAVRLFQLPDSY